MNMKEIEHLKTMKINVPKEWATDKYVLVDESDGFPWDKDRYPDSLAMPKTREPGETINEVIKLLENEKIPVIILNHSAVRHKRHSQTLRQGELHSLNYISRLCFVFIEKEAGKLERWTNKEMYK